MTTIKKQKFKKRSEDEDYIIYTETNKRHKKTKKYISTGEWSDKENAIYVRFLEKNLPLFESEFVRRSTKVFRKMSTLLRRRDSEQCRSHHQKLVIKFNRNLKSIITNLKLKIREPESNIGLTANREEKLESNYKMNKKENIPTGLGSLEIFLDNFKIEAEKDDEIRLVLNIKGIECW